MLEQTIKKEVYEWGMKRYKNDEGKVYDALMTQDYEILK